MLLPEATQRNAKTIIERKWYKCKMNLKRFQDGKLTSEDKDKLLEEALVTLVVHYNLFNQCETAQQILLIEQEFQVKEKFK